MDDPKFDWHLEVRPPLGTRPACLSRNLGERSNVTMQSTTIASQSKVSTIPSTEEASEEFLTATLSFEEIPEGGIITSPHRPRDVFTGESTRELPMIPRLVLDSDIVMIQKPEKLRSNQSNVWDDHHKPPKKRKRSLQGKILGPEYERPGKIRRGWKARLRVMPRAA
jgi:hypothetical protein